MKVYCIKENDALFFYLIVKNETYFMFVQRYSKSVFDFYCNAQHLERAIDCTRAKRNPSIINVMNRIKSYRKYIKQEYNIDYTSYKKRKMKAAY